MRINSLKYRAGGNSKGTSCPSFYLFLLIFSCLSGATTAQPLVLPSVPPNILGLEFSGELYDEVGTAAFFANTPPDGLITGFASPITARWGPVEVFWGLDPWSPESDRRQTRQTYQLLSPAGLEARISEIRSVVQACREKGIARIAPTFSFSTISGDHQKRLGFWEFYDRWEHYSQWMGPRPWNDPLDWLCVDKDGDPIMETADPPNSEHARKFRRYRCCIHHPDWAGFQQSVLKLCAESGYDGGFADDVSPVPCFCRHCTRCFREFLDSAERPAWVGRLAGERELSRLALDSPETPPELIRRWRMLSTAAHLESLRAAGKGVDPSFAITAGGLSLAESAPVGEEADYLLFAEVGAPGLMSTGEIPENDHVRVAVVDEAVRTEFLNTVFRIRNPETGGVVRARIRLPASTRAGESAPVTVHFLNDSRAAAREDALSDFHLSFEGEKGDATKVPLEPAPAAEGSVSAEENAEAAQSEWAGQWTPKAPGTYSVSFGFTHHEKSDAASQDIPYRAQLRWPHLCRTHIAELQFARQMQAQPLLVGKEWFAQRSPVPVRELALAEAAAFGGGCYVGNEPPQAFAAFPRAHRDLFENWQPTGSIGVLYAAWGPNPLSLEPNETPSGIAHQLGAAHRPYVALIDRNLPSDAALLSGLAAIHLACGEYELTDVQIGALRQYQERGGRLVLATADVLINGGSAASVFGSEVGVWDAANPVLPGEPLVSGGPGIENLRVAVYSQPDRLAVHLVNYNVCLLHPRAEPIGLENVQVAIPLPEGWLNVQAITLAPGEDPLAISAAVETTRAVVTLPQVGIYRVLVLERAAMEPRE